MKYFFLFIIALVLIGNIYSQDCHRQLFQKSAIEPCKIYDYQYVMDAVRKEPFRDMQALEIGGTMSRYYSLFGEKIDSLFAYAKGNDIRPDAWKTDNERELYEDYYLNYPRYGTMLVSTGLVRQEYQYEEPVPHFSWTTDFTPTTVILGYTCRKATATFRGRDYEVWYTLDIPIPSGPWKLNGLPGLILRAKTLDGLFSWDAIGIEQPDNHKIYFYDKSNSSKVDYPMKFVTVSRKQMRFLQEQRWKDPIGLYNQHGQEYEIWKQDPKTGKITKYDKPGSYQKPYIPPLELE